MYGYGDARDHTLCTLHRWTLTCDNIDALLRFTLRVHRIDKILKRSRVELQVALLLSLYALPKEFTGIFTNDPMRVVKNWHMFIAVAAGLWGGLAIGIVTEYYTSNAYQPVKVRICPSSQLKCISVGCRRCDSGCKQAQQHSRQGLGIHCLRSAVCYPECGWTDAAVLLLRRLWLRHAAPELPQTSSSVWLWVTSLASYPRSCWQSSSTCRSPSPTCTALPARRLACSARWHLVTSTSKLSYLCHLPLPVKSLVNVANFTKPCRICCP